MKDNGIFHSHPLVYDHARHTKTFVPPGQINKLQLNALGHLPKLVRQGFVEGLIFAFPAPDSTCCLPAGLPPKEGRQGQTYAGDQAGIRFKPQRPLRRRKVLRD